MHGATYPSETTFDLQLNGYSWMDYLAKNGWDVYCVDLRGYGRSTRPLEMEDLPEKNKPLVSTKQAVSDLGFAVRFIIKRENLHSIYLMGWSWGATIAAQFTILNQKLVTRLVLYTPEWVHEPPVYGEQSPAPADLGAYRTVTKADAKARWLKGLNEDQVAGLIPEKWFEYFYNQTWSSDPKSEFGDLRAPNGVRQD